MKTMRDIIDTLNKNVLTEAPVKTKTKTRTGLDDLSPSPNLSNLSTRSQDRQPSFIDPSSNKASREKTQRSMRGMDPASTERARGYLSAIDQSGLEDTDVPGDFDAGYIEPKPKPESTTLPAVLVKSVSTVSGEPEWHEVKNLPGYARSAIRALGRQIFKHFTSTPIEEINVLSTLSNSDTEVKGVMAWIRDNGVKNDEAEVKMDELVPGYKGNTQVWNVDDHTFLLVQDFAGYYIYSWPSTDRLSDRNTSTRRLR